MIGANEIVALDGVQGLIHVARQLGRWLQADPVFWVDAYLIERFTALTGEEGGLGALAREAVVGADAANCLAAERQTLDSRSVCDSAFDAMTYTAAQIVARVKRNPRDPYHWFNGWGARVDSEQCEAVFRALLRRSHQNRELLVVR